MAGYRDLKGYQEAHRLGVSIHKFSLKMPKFELYETGSRIRGASKAISANIVEGYGCWRYHADYVKFLVYAQSSREETTEWLECVRDLCDDVKAEAERLLHEIDGLGRQINVSIQSVEARPSR